MTNTKTTGEQTRHDFKTKGWSMNGTRCHISKIAKEFKGDNGEVVHACMTASFPLPKDHWSAGKHRSCPPCSPHNRKNQNPPG